MLLCLYLQTLSLNLLFYCSLVYRKMRRDPVGPSHPLRQSHLPQISLGIFFFESNLDPDLLYHGVLKIDDICAKNENNADKYCGGNVGNNGQKMCIAKDYMTKHHVYQKSKQNEIDSSVQLLLGKYVFVTVNQNKTQVQVHS